MNQTDKINLAQWGVEKARKYGADEIAVTITQSDEVKVIQQNRKLDRLQQASKNSLGLQVYCNHRYSSHSTSNLDQTSLDSFVKQAVELTRLIPPDEFRSLPPRNFSPSEQSLDLDLLDPAYQSLSLNRKKEIVADIEEHALRQSDQVISAESWFCDIFTEQVKLHSNGWIGRSQNTHFSQGTDVSVKGPDSARPEYYFSCEASHWNALPSPSWIGQDTARRAMRKIGQTKCKSGPYSILVENRQAGRLINMLLAPLSAAAIQQKKSFLEGMHGQKITSDQLTLIDDPHLRQGLQSRFYDSEGLASQKRMIIDQGILKNYYIDYYYGRKLSLSPTSGSPSNLLFAPGSKSLSQLCMDLQDGILIDGFIGGNSNSTTGDFSLGIRGHRIRDGVLAEPLAEINLTGNNKSFWNQLVEVGTDPFRLSAWQWPTLRFDNITLNGI